VCQNTLAAKLLCAIEFAPGTYTTQGTLVQAHFTIKRANRVVVHGTFKVHNGHVTTTRIRHLGHGHYTLTVTVGHGPNTRVLLHQAVLIH
jgi:hypothetical protein